MRPPHPTCTISDKRRYKTHTAAENFLRTLVRSKKWQRRALYGYVEIRAYHCSHCDGWHLTHQPKRGLL